MEQSEITSKKQTSIAVKLSAKLVEDARRYAVIEDRSVARQIEHWAKIGKIARDNPDLSYTFIEGILIGLEEIRRGDGESFSFTHIKNA